MKINRWGDELYTDKTLIVAEEENAQSVVKPLDVAYWPEGNALCLFYGSTPISKSPDKILPYSPVNIVGKIITKDDILEEFKDDSTVVSPDEDKVRNIDVPETKQMRGYLHSEVKDLIESWILPIETMQLMYELDMTHAEIEFIEEQTEIVCELVNGIIDRRYNMREEKIENRLTREDVNDGEE